MRYRVDVQLVNSVMQYIAVKQNNEVYFQGEIVLSAETRMQRLLQGYKHVLGIFKQQYQPSSEEDTLIVLIRSGTLYKVCLEGKTTAQYKNKLEQLIEELKTMPCKVEIIYMPKTAFRNQAVKVEAEEYISADTLFTGIEE